MSAGTTPTLMTVEEFAALPDPPGAKLELRHGEPVPVTFPKWDHVDLQDRIRDLCKQRFPGHVVRTEIPFRPFPQHELWAADIAVVSRDRWMGSARGDGWLMGSPELVIEVASPSNTPDELDDRERTAIAGGAQQFWVVYSKKQRYVRVAHANGTVRRYDAGDEIPVGNGTIAVTDIFSVLP
jgi:Uma2 family endonuclease